MSDVPMDVDMETINIMVVGECGDGKSTLINGLRDHRKSHQAMCGKDPQGVTKEIVMYPCPDLEGKALNVLDTPGVGDHQISPVALITMIEEFLKAGMVPGGVRGVVVTTPIPDGRIRLGAQIVQAIVDKGFVAPDREDKYGNIILCGTKLDKADEEERQCFLEGWNGKPSVKELFFKNSARKTGPCVMVSNQDYSPLLAAIRALPAMTIRYEKPKSDVMAAALAEKLGMRPEDLQSQMDAFREMVESQSQQIKELMQGMHEEQRRHREEIAKKDHMLQDMLMKLQEERKQAEEARLQREAALEEMRREQDEERRRERAEAVEVQRQMQERRQQEAARAQQHYEQLQREREESNRKHQEQLLKMQKDHQAAMRTAMEDAKSAQANKKPWAEYAVQVLGMLLPFATGRLMSAAT
ncbi:putative conserved tandem protein 13 [Amphidinium carterae]